MCFTLCLVQCSRLSAQAIGTLGFSATTSPATAQRLPRRPEERRGAGATDPHPMAQSASASHKVLSRQAV